MTWQAVITGQGYVNEALSGSASFVFESDDLDLATPYATTTGSFDYFSQSPNPIGQTVFDTANTGYLLQWDGNGNYVYVRVGGLVGGGNSVNAANDDFLMTWWKGDPGTFGFSVGAHAGIVTDGTATATVSFVIVPEPTTLALAGLGLLGVGYRRRKRA